MKIRSILKLRNFIFMWLLKAASGVLHALTLTAEACVVSWWSFTRDEESLKWKPNHLIIIPASRNCLKSLGSAVGPRQEGNWKCYIIDDDEWRPGNAALRRYKSSRLTNYLVYKQTLFGNTTYTVSKIHCCPLGYYKEHYRGLFSPKLNLQGCLVGMYFAAYLDRQSSSPNSIYAYGIIFHDT